MRIDIWSDLVCPWCYIGKRRFETALATFAHAGDIDVVHRAFQPDPTMPPGQLFRHRDVLMRKYGLNEAQLAATQARLEQLAADEGLEYHLADAMTGNTRDAHRLVRLARDQHRQDAVIERFFRAHFTEGRSLFDAQSLTMLSEETGLTGAAQLLASDRYAEDVVNDHQEANALGANGVPFFVIDDRYGISGAQATEVFSETLERAWKERGLESTPGYS